MHVTTIVLVCVSSFKINASSGELSAAGAAAGAAAETRPVVLDRERASWVEFTVRCVDEEGRGFEARSVVRVELDDVNDNSPKFEKTRYVVHELAVRYKRGHAVDSRKSIRP